MTGGKARAADQLDGQKCTTTATEKRRRKVYISERCKAKGKPPMNPKGKKKKERKTKKQSTFLDKEFITSRGF